MTLLSRSMLPEDAPLGLAVLRREAVGAGSASADMATSCRAVSDRTRYAAAVAGRSRTAARRRHCYSLPGRYFCGMMTTSDLDVVSMSYPRLSGTSASSPRLP